MNKFVYRLSQMLRHIGFRFHEENDSRVMAMRETIRKIGSIKFNIEVAADGSWAAESTNIDGIITGGRHTRDINEMLKDAVFTYFEIPPHLCNDSLMNALGEPLKLEQHMYAA